MSTGQLFSNTESWTQVSTTVKASMACPDGFKRFMIDEIGKHADFKERTVRLQETTWN